MVSVKAPRESLHGPLSTGSGPASLDDPLYYLHNFQWVLDWVLMHYHDLLGDEELTFAEQFAGLPRPSRALLVRMVMRKGHIFRANKLSYAEIGPIETAAEPLQVLGWLRVGPELSLETLFTLYTWPELRRLLAALLQAQGVSARSTKREALERLMECGLEPVCATAWGLEEQAVFELTVMPRANRFRWLFFGNPYQDWSEFVLAELGLFQYEPVVFDQQSRPVHTEAELQQYWQLQECRRQLHEQRPLDEVTLKTLEAQLPALVSDNPWLVRTRDRLLFRLGQGWERAGQLECAREAYTGCAYPGARGRLLRVLERLEDYSAALTLAQGAQRMPESETEVQQLGRLLPRLHRKLGLGFTPPPKAEEPLSLEMELPACAPVELAVLEQLAAPESPVFYAENTLLSGLFGLLFWDAVFAPVTGAFFHPFQSGPADLYWPDFYRRRQAVFERGFTALASGDYKKLILDRYQQKWGRQSPFVYWSALSEELIHTALNCIPPEHITLCFERFLRDLKANCSGLPDLIQFWPAQQRYRMIEVKGPGDRLQDNQKRWLAFFAQHRIPACVCYVRWQEAGAQK